MVNFVRFLKLSSYHSRDEVHLAFLSMIRWCLHLTTRSMTFYRLESLTMCVHTAYWLLEVVPPCLLERIILGKIGAYIAFFAITQYDSSLTYPDFRALERTEWFDDGVCIDHCYWGWIRVGLQSYLQSGKFSDSSWKANQKICFIAAIILVPLCTPLACGLHACHQLCFTTLLWCATFSSYLTSCSHL